MSNDENQFAIVIQRAHPDIVGGSETHGLLYAKILSRLGKVEVISTDACDTTKWESCGEREIDLSDRLKLLRFPVKGGRSPFWHKLHRRLSDLHRTRESFDDRSIHPWSVAMQEMWIREQGPHSPEMLQYLKTNQHRFKNIFFITYLFPTTYFGIDQVDGEKSILVPTLHDEPPAYLPVFGTMARKVSTILANTPEENRLIHRLWGIENDRIGGVPIQIPSSINRETDLSKKTTILYLGRIHPGKGIGDLLKMLPMFSSNNLKLVLAGPVEMKLPIHESLIVMGVITEDQKTDLFSKIRYLIQPSTLESLSIVTLEALAHGVPVLARGESEVLRGHKASSQSIAMYHSQEELAGILSDHSLYQKLKGNAMEKGTAYVKDGYSEEVIESRIRRAIGL